MTSAEEEDVKFVTCKVCDLPFTGIKPFEQHMKGKKHLKQLESRKRKMQVKSMGGNPCMEEMKCPDAPDYTCDVCETACSGIIPYTQHLNSKPHAKALRKKDCENDPAQFENAGNGSEISDNDADLNAMVQKLFPKPYGSCSTCGKQFSGPESYLAHMTSKSHAKRRYEPQLLDKIQEMFDICEVRQPEETCESGKQENGFAGGGTEKELKCKGCGKVFSGAISFAQHLVSKTHAKKESQNELINEIQAIMMKEWEAESSSSENEDSSQVLTCQICRMVFNGPENLKAHIKSRRHQKAVTWKKHQARKEKSTDITHTSPEEKDDTEKPFTQKETNPPVKMESSSAVVARDEPSVEAAWVMLEIPS